MSEELRVQVDITLSDLKSLIESAELCARNLRHAGYSMKRYDCSELDRAADDWYSLRDRLSDALMEACGKGNVSGE